MDTPFKWEVVLREEGSTLTGIVNSCDTGGPDGLRIGHHPPHDHLAVALVVLFDLRALASRTRSDAMSMAKGRIRTTGSDDCRFSSATRDYA